MTEQVITDSIAGMKRELSARRVLLRFAGTDEIRQLMKEITLLRNNINAMKMIQSGSYSQPLTALVIAYQALNIFCLS